MDVPALLTASALAIAQTVAPAPSRDVPLLVVLSPTGVTREGLPVYTRHAAAAAYEAALTRGFSGRLLHLFRWEQQLLARRDGTAVEPAYLLLSRNQGGFPRFGFWLDQVRKSGVGYVDLHERSAPSGRFGAIDQIFPHELMHVILHQLARLPPPASGGGNQVHAVGVRTDRLTAFDEGFAEHAQVLAIDDPDALPDTAALAHDTTAAALARQRLAEYRRALEARWAPAPPARLAFVLWFSQTEQVLRYDAVKANAFAREPHVDPRFARAEPYRAYLLENVLPGEPGAAVKSTPRLLSSEGVIAALFSRWVTDPALERGINDPAFYDRFGVRAGEVGPLQQAYLKLFAVMADRQPHEAAALVRDYVAEFPEDAEAVATLVRRTGFSWPLPRTPEIWLANDRFRTGTSLFDQYRAMPRVHTFDLNAASALDLLTVDGVSASLATAIQRGAPYTSLADLARVPGMSPALISRFRAMHTAMDAVREANAREDAEDLNLMRLFAPVLIRAALFAIAVAVAGGWLYRLVRRGQAGWWRVVTNGLAVAVFGLLPAWILSASLQLDRGAVAPAWFVFLPVVLFGLPGAVWQITRRRSWKTGGLVMAAWTIACLPILFIVVPLG